MNKYLMLFLAVIVLLGFWIRVYNINQIPHGFFADEASIGYNAYTLLHNGTDEYGNKFPLLFESFGGTFYRPGVSIYITALPVLFFGLNEFAIRFSPVLIGTLTIIVIFLLARILFSSNVAGLLSAFFIAISPWHIHFSRINQEFVYFVFFLVLGLYIFLLSIKLKNYKLLILSFLVFGLTLYTYVVAYFLIPLLLVTLFVIYRKNILIMRKGVIFGLIIFFATSIPLISGLNSGKTLSRFNQLKTTNENRTQIEFLKGALTTYKDHFMPEFLFEKGDIGYHSHFITRFSIRGMGELYWIQLPLILLGFLYAFSKNKKSGLLLSGLLAIYPLGSSIVPFADGGGPFAMRSIIGVIPFQILSALGVIFIYSLFKDKFYKFAIIVSILILMFFSFNNYLHRYFVEYPLYSSDFWGWQYGPRDVMNYFIKVNGQYDDLFLMGSFNSPEIFIKFYDPQNICRFHCQVGGLEKLDFNRKQLYAVGADRIGEMAKYNFKIKKIIDFPDGKPAFFIGSPQENKF